MHTNDIGAAIEAALDLDGRPRQIRVTDLFEEVADEHAEREAELVAAMPVTPASPADGLPAVTSAVVAVSSGDGLAELFGQLGVQGIVTGGQTMNPSTAELLDAVERGQRRPGRGPARTTRTSSRSPSRSTRSPPRPCASCRPGRCPRRSPRSIVYDPEADAPSQRAGRCADAADAVATGEVTQAVRDGDHRRPARSPTATGSGIVRGDGIVAVGARRRWRRRTALLEQLVDDERELVTVITGADADAGVTAELVSWMADRPPGRRGRGARRRSAAVPVPVRRRVSAEPAVAERRIYAARARRHRRRRG